MRRTFVFGPVMAVALGACALCPSACNRPPQQTSAPGTGRTPPATTPPPAAAPVPRNLATLTVKVTGLRNHGGQLIFGVFSSADGFPNVQAKSVNWQVKDATADEVSFTATLPPGEYAASVLHDENRNGDMDRGVGGIPKEGYGVTNNPKPKLRAATFKEATFTLPPEGASLTISVQYSFF